ncbi:hypothetical protein KIW84_042031 [Lathyrus oleraceus]|uniref:Uncharacterized protein n=1 Tax=Pisum sativum TaxID=3888 RepID=A0A9D4XBI4_PEA|nr:hypothetical protein KIW84_042031 [Pisum sativum]
MNVNGGFSINILTLDGDNFERWSALMKSLFEAQYLLEIVQEGYEELGANPTDAQRITFKESRKKVKVSTQPWPVHATISNEGPARQENPVVHIDEEDPQYV